MMRNTLFLLLFALMLGSLQGCNNDKQPKKQPQSQMQNKTLNRPAFQADSAYTYIEKQVSFGPRVPGTDAHKQASIWLKKTLSAFTDSTFIQETSATMYSGKTIPVYNIIGQINPTADQRILLAAHWDTRHIADKDEDEALYEKPIDGANDGASGVGVLLEIARQLHQLDITKGIDIIFFDAEDLGKPQNSSSTMQDTWCLGSQYWAQNPHVANYRASYGILLDMVGASDAIFKFEYYAYQKAAPIYTKTWNNAHSLGFSHLFEKKPGGQIIDDHTYVIHYRNFPMINIIDYDDNKGGFGHFHHTHKDNMNVIDKHTLQAVGETVLATILE